MTTFSDRLQLLLEQQQQCFKNSQLNFLENLRTLLKLASSFLICRQLENNCRTYEAVYKSLCESRTTSDVNETVIHGPPSCPEMSNSETFPVVGSNPTVPERCEVSSLQEEPLVPEDVSRASNNGQKSNMNFKDAVCFSDLLSSDRILKRSEEYVAQESNLNDLMSGVTNPHHLVSFSEPPTQCAKYALIRIRLTVTWVYEDPTLFRGGG
ncbi:unnamed protein product [Schistosoma mattheei]|uniref:Uncharacterized protein n=1 Tax=Schistosoma mattheei TaxID=31246 RepID=A0AA85AU01_9TREM|nr:unnamed protein product [Schistosoma mattheei]